MTLPWFCRTKPMLKYEYNYCFSMVFVRNQGRTISIPTLDAQSLDGYYAISTLGEWVFVKNQPIKSRLDIYNFSLCIPHTSHLTPTPSHISPVLLMRSAEALKSSSTLVVSGNLLSLKASSRSILGKTSR